MHPHLILKRELPPPQKLPGTDQIWMIAVPVPYSPIRFTQTFVVKGDEGLLMIDPGPNTPETKEVLISGMERMNLLLSDVIGVLVTHYHFDHYGLAPWMRDTHGSWIGLGASDSSIIESRRDGLGSAGDDWLGTLGVPDEELQAIGTSWRERARVGQEPPDLWLEDNEKFATSSGAITAISTPGHTPGHMCFYLEEQRILLSGDHVLPRITPNIAFNPDSGDNPLRDYLHSLQRLKQLNNPRTFPAHIGTLDDLDQRIDEIDTHHQRRLAEHLKVVRSGFSTAWEIASQLTWSSRWDDMDSGKKRQALGETHAHLVHLRHQGAITSSETTPFIWNGAPDT